MEQIALAADSPALVPDLARDTLQKVRHRFDKVPSDTGFQAAFAFLLGLATNPEHQGLSADPYPDVDLTANPSTPRLVGQLAAWVDGHADSREYAELAKRAAADAIVFWSTRHLQQKEMFAADITTSQLWMQARSGSAFSDLCRVFFGKFTERYLKYFLDREASAKLATAEARERFQASLVSHVTQLATHSFETTRIAQSFAAGWYNKHAREQRPDRRAINAFLSYALGKLRQELLRESAPS